MRSLVISPKIVEAVQDLGSFALKLLGQLITRGEFYNINRHLKPSVSPEGGSTKSWGHGLSLSKMKRIVDVCVSTLDVSFYSTTCSFLKDTTTL